MTFTYKRLDGWLMPGTGYFKALQEHAIEMEHEISVLRKQAAISGNKYYQRDAAKWGEEWQKKCIEAGELKRQLIELEAEKDAEIKRLEYEIRYLQEQLEQYQTAQKPVTTKKRDSNTGKFIADIPKSKKIQQAYEMYNNGYSLNQIACRLHISTETVKKYIAEYKRQLDNQWFQAQVNASGWD